MILITLTSSEKVGLPGRSVGQVCDDSPPVLQVKNKAPAEVQITAEQLLREAKERELELLPPPPKQKITDKEELNDYKLKKRKVGAGLTFSQLTVVSTDLIQQKSHKLTGLQTHL